METIKTLTLIIAVIIALTAGIFGPIHVYNSQRAETLEVVSYETIKPVLHTTVFGTRVAVIEINNIRYYAPQNAIIVQFITFTGYEMKYITGDENIIKGKELDYAKVNLKHTYDLTPVEEWHELFK